MNLLRSVLPLEPSRIDVSTPQTAEVELSANGKSERCARMVPIGPTYRTWCKKKMKKMMVMMLLMMMMKMVKTEDGDGGDGDDAQKMNGLLSCGLKKYNILHAVTMVSIMTIFSPMKLRMKHVKSKTVHKTQCNCVIQTTLNH